jgi:alpha-tubulin suppressor-like RCC1 family protein
LSSTEKGGYIYAWGTGTFGQLGMEEDTVKIYDEFKLPSPTIIYSLQEIVSIACGEESMAAITRSGTLFTWGKGEAGTLGHGDEVDQYLPRQVLSLAEEKIVRVRCGTCHMAAINDIGEIFTWGHNYLGPLGRILSKGKESDSTPQLVELVQIGAVVSEENLKGSDEFEFTQVECLKHNTVALSKQGQVYSCGKGGSDGGGHGDQPHTLLCLLDSITKLKVKQLARAKNNHIGAVVKTTDRKHAVYMWGNADEGKLGFGDLLPQLHPKLLLDGRDCYDLACGETHTAAIFEPLDSDVNSQPEASLDEISGEYESDYEVDDKVDDMVPTPVNVINVTPIQEKIDETPVTPKQEEIKSNVIENNESDEESGYEDESPAVVSSTTNSPAPSPAPTSPIAQPTSQQRSGTISKVTVEIIDKDSEKNFLRSEFNSSPSSISQNKAPTGSVSKRVLEDVQGYLNKRGDKGIVKLWRKRHFKMNMTTIEYYEKEDLGKKGIIKLSDILDVLQGQVKFGFNLTSRTGRIYELQAFDNDSYHTWAQGIRQRLKPV